MSGSKGIVIAEDLHTVLCVAPVDINGGVVNSDVWSMGKYAHASIFIMFGVTGAAVTVTIEECDNFTPSNTTAIAYASYAEETAGGDTLAARVATASSGIVGSTNDGIFYVAEIDASQLSDGRPNLRVVSSNPAAPTLMCVVAILSGPRYAGETGASPTAIA